MAKKSINEWLVYNGTSVDVNPTNKNNRKYVYFKATDNDKNVTFVSTAGIVFDLSAPTISGITAGATYCESIEFTVNDANLSKVVVDDQVLFDDSVVAASEDSGITAAAIGDNKFTAKFEHDGSKEVTITVTDKAGNTATCKVTINGKHVKGRSVTEMRRAASCINIGEGTKLTYCQNCGLIMERDDNYTEKMTPHSWSSWTEVSSVLCGDTTKERKCRNCGLVETQTEGGSHKWAEEYTIDKEPTCINPGYKSKHCTVCGISNPEDTVPVGTLDHQAGEVKTTVVKEETCTEEGATKTTVYCINCMSEMGTTYEKIPAKGHDFSEWTKVETSDPESNTLKRVCKTCGYSETKTDEAIHNWSKEKIVDKAATCTTDGSKSYHCLNGCGSTSEAEVIPATGHKPLEAVQETVIAATCTEAGRYNEVIYCETCKEAISSKPVTVPAKGHTFGEWEEIVSQSTGEVNEERKCEVCGFTETRGMDLENHKWNKEYTVDVEPTCTTEGSKSIHCSVCGLTKPDSSETLAAKGHNWDEWKTISSPDCDDEGAQERECKVCGDKETKNLSPNGHTWNSEYTIDKEATCTTDGSRSIHCSKCDAVEKSEVIPAKGHTFGEWEEIKTADGKSNYQRKCEVCGFAEVKGTDLENHKWNTEYTVDVEPTCTTEGSESIHCSVCGLEKPNSSRVIAALGHKFGEWKTISSPDCDDEGTQERECEVCGVKETNGLSANGHTWEDHYTVDKAATCLEDGSESIHCEKCDAVKGSRAIPAPGHHTPAAERKGAKAATPTEDGYTGDVVCEACEEVLEKGEIIPATMGTLDVIPEAGDGAPALTLTETGKIDLEDAVLTPEEKEALNNGADIDIILSIDDATATVTADDKALTDKAVADKYTVGQYITIDITKIIDGKEFAVTQLGKEISLTIAVPEALKAEGRTFAIVRIHDGMADILSDLDDDADTITFKTDKFSVYAIVYADKAAEPTPPETSEPDSSTPDSSLNDNSPATGGDFSLVFMILAAAVLGAVCVIRKENKAR